MNEINQNHIILKRGQVLRISRIQALRCIKGSAWVTAAEDPVDYVLSAGSTIKLRGKSDVLLEALSDGLEIDLKPCA